MRKSLRFEVFHRDSFTCRYCGAKPPDVVLEVDHVLPRVEGGTDDLTNLATSCSSCNRGKARTLLAGQPPALDPDLEYLEVQQEIAEIERYQRSLAVRQEALQGLVADLQQLWCDISDLDWYPQDRVFLSLLIRYSPEVVEAAIRDVAPKIAGGYLKTHNDSKWVAYLNVVARNLAQEE